MTNEGYSLADIAAATNGGYGGRNNDGMFGGDGAWWIIVLFLFMWGRGGFFGGNNDGCGGGGISGFATKSDINDGFALNSLQGGIQSLQNGLCDGFYNVNTSLLQGFNGVERGFCNLSAQLAQCCCDNKAAIADVKYQMAADTCAVTGAINNSTRDILENANNNTRSILDFLVQDKISSLQDTIGALRAENQDLKNDASRSNQNAVLMAAMDANTAQIIRRTGNDCPIPAYVVSAPTPVNFPNWGNGCGCGCNGYNN